MISVVTSQVTDLDGLESHFLWTWLDSSILPKWLDLTQVTSENDSDLTLTQPHFDSSQRVTQVMTRDLSHDKLLFNKKKKSLLNFMYWTHTHTRLSAWIMWSCEPWLCPQLILGEKIDNWYYLVTSVNIKMIHSTPLWVLCTVVKMMTTLLTKYFCQFTKGEYTTRSTPYGLELTWRKKMTWLDQLCDFTWLDSKKIAMTWLDSRLEYFRLDLTWVL